VTKDGSLADVALKSLFLGPQSENAVWLQSAVNDLLVRWFEWRQSRYVEDGRAISLTDTSSISFKEQRVQAKNMLAELSSRLEEEIPKYSPRYMGHMFSEISMPALLGHLAALIHNSNIISCESARIAVKIEDEAISELLKMIGFSDLAGTGHFTSGGTLANFEAVVRARARLALWMAVGAALSQATQEAANPLDDGVMGWALFDQKLRQLKEFVPDWQAAVDSWNFEKIGYADFKQRMLHVFGINLGNPVMLVPYHRHYCWPKAAALFGFGDETLKNISLDAEGHLDPASLSHRIAQARSSNSPVMMVVSVVGTTELGLVDPVHEVNEVCEATGHVWHHVDAAYGGFFATMNREVCLEMTDNLEKSLQGMGIAQSVTIDPHKLGYVPYSAGVFLTRDRRNYDLKSVSVPYIQYSDFDRGPFTIEGSRPVTGAAATWMVSKTIKLNAEGMGSIIARNFHARKMLEQELLKSRLPVRVAKTNDTNVLCFVVARQGENISSVNTRTSKIYDSMSGNNSKFMVSKTTIDWQHYPALCDRFSSSWSSTNDTGEISLVRICLMNPFFTSKEMALSYPSSFVSDLEAVVGDD